APGRGSDRRAVPDDAEGPLPVPLPAGRGRQRGATRPRARAVTGPKRAGSVGSAPLAGSPGRQRTFGHTDYLFRPRRCTMPRYLGQANGSAVASASSPSLPFPLVRPFLFSGRDAAPPGPPRASFPMGVRDGQEV